MRAGLHPGAATLARRGGRPVSDDDMFKITPADPADTEKAELVEKHVNWLVRQPMDFFQMCGELIWMACYRQALEAYIKAIAPSYLRLIELGERGHPVWGKPPGDWDEN